MKKFKYKLDPLLKIRKFKEKMEYAQYAVVLGRVNKLQAEILSAASNQKTLLENEKRQMAEGRFDLKERLIAQQYKQTLSTIKDASLKKIDSMKTEFEALRKKAEAARKSRRVLEILRDKKQAEFHTMIEKVESRQMDEFNQRKRKGY